MRPAELRACIIAWADDEIRTKRLQEMAKLVLDHILFNGILERRDLVRIIGESGPPYSRGRSQDRPHSLNQHTRESQRAMIASKIANMKKGQFYGNQHPNRVGPIGPTQNDAPVSIRQASKMMKVSAGYEARKCGAHPRVRAPH